MVKTPNIDKLIKTGVEMRRFYALPVCTPTRAAFLGGRYPIHTGLQHNVIRPCEASGLDLTRPLISNVLKGVGYRTAIVGKWHLGMHTWDHTPMRRGFDHFYGYLNGAEDYWTHKRALKKKDKAVLDFRRNYKAVTDQKGIYSTKSFVKETERVLSNASASTPLFLYLPFQSAHAPLQAPDKYVNQYKHIKDKKRRLHAAQLAVFDDAVGDVVKLLKQKGYWDNTVLFFSADNGGQTKNMGLNWPLRGGKGTIFEGGTRLVAFANSPFLQAGRTNALIHGVDLFPTFIRLGTGQTPNPQEWSWVDGVDQWDTIASSASSGPRTEILYNIDPKIKYKGHSQAAIRDDKWKLILGTPCSSHNGKYCGWLPEPNKGKYQTATQGDGVMLFNLQKDPNERDDVSKKYPEVVKKLKARLAEYKKTMVPPGNKKPDPKCDPAKAGVWEPWL
jgi:arylsulfatase A-like enzyme